MIKNRYKFINSSNSKDRMWTKNELKTISKNFKLNIKEENNYVLCCSNKHG